jgi:ferric-dicitrate binding protein FerR (iron transport regulator)
LVVEPWLNRLKERRAAEHTDQPDQVRMEELILRFLSGEASSFEKARLKRWRAESPENEARFQELSHLWDLTCPPSLSNIGPGEIRELAKSIEAEAEARRGEGVPVDPTDPIPSTTPSLMRSLAPWGVAFAATVAALAFGLRAIDSPLRAPGLDPSVPSIALSAQTLRLDDGSFVRLSAGSRLEASLGEEQRTVKLNGKAFFAVAPDGDRPFVVRTEGGEVLVLGTRFEVAHDLHGIRTVVIEGRVALNTPEGRVEVPMGSMGESRGGSAPTVTAVDDVLTLLDWPGGLLVFHDTPLSTVAREVQRHFQIPVRLDQPTVEGPRISASFEDGESFEEVVETLCSITRSACRISADSAVIGSSAGGVQ